MRQSFTPSFIRLIPEPSTRNYGLGWVALAALASACLVCRVSAPVTFSVAAICVQLATVVAVWRVVRWRVAGQLAIDSDATLYVAIGGAFRPASVLPASVFTRRWCYLQLQVGSDIWHAVLRANRNLPGWRHFHVLRRWCRAAPNSADLP